MKKLLRSIVEKFETGWNSIFGNSNYTKLVILTRSRTGSNLLMSLLNSHDNILMYGEVFRRLEDSSCQDLWNKTFSKKNKRVKYTGFKIFYYHPLESNDRKVWDYIQNDENITIIHLTRQNMLRTVVSQEIANKTKVWTNKGNRNPGIKEKKITADPSNFADQFELTRNYENEFRALYSNKSYIEVSYEQLIEDNQLVMNRLFQFLNLDQVEVFSDYKKQNRESLKDLVLNYDELIAYINDSEWSYLLEYENN